MTHDAVDAPKRRSLLLSVQYAVLGTKANVGRHVVLAARTHLLCCVLCDSSAQAGDTVTNPTVIQRPLQCTIGDSQSTLLYFPTQCEGYLRRDVKHREAKTEGGEVCLFLTTCGLFSFTFDVKTVLYKLMIEY